MIYHSTIPLLSRVCEGVGRSSITQVMFLTMFRDIHLRREIYDWQEAIVPCQKRHSSCLLCPWRTFYDVLHVLISVFC